jgi:dihydrolipoamide dehydrogenase
MQTRKVDVAVVGAGTAGLSARREAVKRGADVVMIESGPYGTTCARVGCMPSKLLIAAADIAHEIRHAKRFGVEAPGGPQIDGRAVLERVRKHRDRFAGFVVEATEELPPEQKLRGHARFVAPTTLEVGDHTRVEAKAVVIAAGSSAWIPPSLEAVREHVLISDDVFEIEDLPESIAVIGTGIIGVEIGQAMHRLGVRTSLFSHSDRIGPVTDPEVKRAIRSTLSNELDLHLDATLEVERSASGGFTVRWRSLDGDRGEAEFAALLAATGRRPNVEGLGLKNTGLTLDERGIPTINHRTMQCGDLPIFMAGDVSNCRPVLHEAADEGKIAGTNAALFPEVRAHTRRTPLSITFSDPQIAMVGCAYRDLDCNEIEIGAVSYEDQGRAVVMGKNAGLVRIYGEPECGTLLGAEMFGPRVENTAHLLAWAVQARLDVEQALDMPFYHPVVEEGIRTALRDLSARLQVRGVARPKDLECGPGT